MYILLIFNDQECEKLNCIWLYDRLNDVIKDTKHFIKYGDINRIHRVYKTSKSFFRLLKIKKDDAKLYFS
jgi:hypothetical protein